MTAYAWLTDGWMPATSEPVPVLEELRPGHLQALADYQTARRAASGVGARHSRQDAELRARVRAGEPAGGVAVASPVERDAEHQVAREREAQAMLTLCDVVEAVVDRLLERRGELEAFVNGHRSRRGADPEDTRAVDRLLIGLRTDGAIIGTVAAARHEASAQLAGRPVTAW